MILLHNFDHQTRWTEGDSYFNRYNDSDFGEKIGYLMLGRVSQTTDIYNDYAIPAGQYQQFELNYKISTYSKRSGQCKVIVQLLNGTDVVGSYESDLLGNYPKQEWHPQLVTGVIPPEVTTIRFRIVPQSNISTSNTLAFTGITIRVRE